MTNNQASDDCTASVLVWGAAEDPGFDNLVMKISTNGSGQITSALVYWTQEYVISFGGPPAGFDNSLSLGAFTFTGGIALPRARDFAVSVFQGSTGNVLDTVANSVNFGGPVMVTIVSGPTSLGSAIVVNNQIIYDSIGAAGTDTIVYEATDGTATDQGTITITVSAVDTVPNPFSFTDQTGLSLATQVTSGPVTISGINTPAPISVTGGAYSIGCTGTFTQAAGAISQGSTVCVRQTTSAFPDTAVDTVLTVGGVSDTFTSTTIRYAIDDTASTVVGTPVEIAILENDLAFPPPVYAGIWIDPLHGTVSVSGSPGPQSGIRINYIPNPGYSGPDSFQYWVEGGSVADYGLVSISVVNNDGDGDGVDNALDNCPAVANPGQQDSDGDGVGEACDNCTQRANANQRDTNGDGYGNICDPDLNNSGQVTAADYAILRSRINTTDADADLNGNGVVTALDYTILRAYLNLPPGPSAAHQ